MIDNDRTSHPHHNNYNHPGIATNRLKLHQNSPVIDLEEKSIIPLLTQIPNEGLSMTLWERADRWADKVDGRGKCG